MGEITEKREDSMKKVDIHLHLTFDGQNDERHADGLAMKQYMEQHGVEHGVLMSWGEFENFMADEVNSSNIDCCALAQKYPETFSWMCNLNPEYETDILYERMLHYKNLGAVGVGEFFYNYWLDHPKILAVLAAAQRAELPVLFHMSPKEGFNYGISDDAGLPRLEQVLKQYPDLIFIGHSQPFWYEIGGGMPSDLESRNSYPVGKVEPGGRLPELLDRYPNLYADLSANSAGNAIMRDPEFGYEFLEKYQDRLMFGTDMVHTGMYFPLGDFLDEAVREKRISSSAYCKIFRNNAVKILKLKIEPTQASEGCTVT